MTSYLVLMSVIFCPRHMSPHLVLRTHKPWTKDQFIGELELSSLIICRLKIVKQKRSSAYQYQRAHRQKLESEKWKLFFRMITFLKLFLKDEMKLSKLFSIWIVFFSYIFSRWTIFLTKVARSTSRRSLAGFRWVIATDWEGYNSSRDQVGSYGWLPLIEKDTIQEGFRWVQMGSDGFRWTQMGSDGWLPLTEEDTIQEENFHLSS